MPCQTKKQKLTYPIHPSPLGQGNGKCFLPRPQKTELLLTYHAIQNIAAGKQCLASLSHKGREAHKGVCCRLEEVTTPGFALPAQMSLHVSTPPMKGRISKEDIGDKDELEDTGWTTDAGIESSR